MPESTLVTKFRQAVSKTKDYRMKREAQFSVQYPTGFLNFDFMNGVNVEVKTEERNFNYYSVGIPDGCMMMIIGRSGCGKTTWAVQAAANIVRPFKDAVIFHDDIEGGITTHRKKVLTGFFGDEYESRYLPRDTGITAENFYERIKMIHDMKIEAAQEYEYDTGLFDEEGNRIFKMIPTVYLLDSIALLMPEKFTDEEELSGSMSATAAAKSNSSVFKRVIPMLKSANIILIMINHITEAISISMFDKKKAQVAYLKQGESLPGGRTIVYLTNLMVRFDDNLKLKASETFGIDGTLVDITMCKSRSGRAGQVVTLVFNQDLGFDSELSMFVMLKNAKLVNGAGNYLYIGDHSEHKFSQKDFKKVLHNNEEFRTIFINTCMELLKDSIKTTNDVVEENKEKDIRFNNMMLDALNTSMYDA